MPFAFCLWPSPSRPFPGLHQFPDFTFYKIALQGADVLDVELAGEMIDFVLERARQQVLAGPFIPLAFDVLGPDSGAFGAGNLLAKARNAQATLFAGLLALQFQNFRE